MKTHAKTVGILMAGTAAMTALLSGCGAGGSANGKTVVEIVQYKPEAVKAFNALEEKFNASHDDPYAYSYNDACTAFARGESAMYVIGSYAVPQIKSVNPDINIDSFVFPASNDPQENILNSGNDLQWSVMAGKENKKDAIYTVLDFLYEDENIQTYLDDQNAVPCKDGDFELPSMLDGMKAYIEEDRMADYQDHHYPSEMAVDAMIQTFLMDDSDDAIDTFLTRFDTEWARYNRDLISKVQKFYEAHPDKLVQTPTSEKTPAEEPEQATEVTAAEEPGQATEATAAEEPEQASEVTLNEEPEQTSEATADEGSEHEADACDSRGADCNEYME